MNIWYATFLGTCWFDKHVVSRPRPAISVPLVLLVPRAGHCVVLWIVALFCLRWFFDPGAMNFLAFVVEKGWRCRSPYDLWEIPWCIW